MCLAEVPPLWCVYTGELERNIDVGQRWNKYPTKDGIFERSTAQNKEEDMDLMTDVQAPLNVYAQEEIQCNIDSIR